MYTSKQGFTAKLNEHVNQCQICSQGTLCDIAERIINDEEARLAQLRKANHERRLRQAKL